MDPRTVHGRLDQVQVVDVREDDEWEAGHIDGARHIPLGRLTARAGEIDRDRPVVTVCRSGSRSGKAAQYLGMLGLSVDNMDGGMKRWAKEGLPFRAAGGGPGRVA